MRTMKINQSIFIKHLVIEERFRDCNTNVISMEARSAIEMNNPEDDKETEL